MNWGYCATEPGAVTLTAGVNEGTFDVAGEEAPTDAAFVINAARSKVARLVMTVAWAYLMRSTP